MNNEFEVYDFFSTLRVVETPIEVSTTFLQSLNEFDDDDKTIECDVNLKPGMVYSIVEGQFEGKQLIYYKKLIYILEDILL
jgi:hypothetical protein